LDKALLIFHPEISTVTRVHSLRCEFTEKLEKAGIQIREVEEVEYLIISSQRLWTVKYEEVYIHSYEARREAKESLDSYFKFYNTDSFTKP